MNELQAELDRLIEAAEKARTGETAYYPEVFTSQAKALARFILDHRADITVSVKVQGGLAWAHPYSVAEKGDYTMLVQPVEKGGWRWYVTRGHFPGAEVTTDAADTEANARAAAETWLAEHREGGGE